MKNKKQHPTLESSTEMCRLLADAAVYHKTIHSWRGDAYGYHPCGILTKGILFKDDWNTNKYCSIQIANSPNVEWWPARNGSSASRCGNISDATPRPKEGSLTDVWRSGQWIKKGPWCDTINNILYEVEINVNFAIAQKKSNEEKEQKEKKIAEKKKDRQLKKAYGS